MSSKKKLLKKLQLGLIRLPWAEQPEALSEATPVVAEATPVVAFREEFPVVENTPTRPAKKTKRTPTRKKSKKSN